MLRIHQSKSVEAARSYYTKGLKQESYYAEKQQSLGKWHGAGAERLGLAGNIQGKDFEALINNRNPVTEERLTARDDTNRTVGYDFTFSAPKSVTLLYELTGDERILEAHKQSVVDTMRDIEKEMMVRVRSSGKNENRISGNMIWGEFNHSTSRPVEGITDPHMHTHAYVFNASFDSVENKWKAGQFKEIKRDAPYFEAAFDARLAISMRKLGYEVEKRAWGKTAGWEIKGVERETIDKFSRRTEEIERIAKEKNIVDDRLKDGLGARSRAGKHESLSKGKLRNEWLGRLSSQELAKISTLHGEALKKSSDRIGEVSKVGASSVGINEVGINETVVNKVENNGVGVNQADIENIQTGENASLAVEKESNSAEIKEKASLAVDYALSHKLERQSVVSEKRLLETALRQGVGNVSVESVHNALASRDDVIAREREGRKFSTTKKVIAEEKEMLGFERFGRGKHKSLVVGGKVKRDFLNAEQRSAVRHVWESYDRVIAIRGGAGVGKTTLMQEAVAGIESGGKKVSVFAPSSEASRGVLRAEGFSGAETVQQLLVNKNMQEKVSDGVIWIDEAGLLGSRTLNKVFKIANEQNARVVLSGDSKQHHSVERGDAFRLLQERGMAVAEVREIQRQQGDYKQAVKHLSTGDIAKGWQGLEDLGVIYEADDLESRKDMVVAAYQQANHKGESVLVVSPTHAEARLITNALRSSEKDAGRLGLEDQDFSVLASLNLTEAEKSQIESFKEGQVIQLHQNIKGFKRGEKAEVLGVDVEKGVVLISGNAKGGNAKGGENTNKESLSSEGEEYRILPLDQAKHFQIYEKRNLGIAEGDKLRITQNGFTFDKQGKKHRLNNGAIYEVKGFNRNGGIKLSNGWLVAKDYGHFNHGYVTTSHASQGKTVDRVLIAQSSQSFRASSQEQFYVSVSRGRKGVEIFTDDKELLQEQISQSNERLSAHELVGEGIAEKKIEQARELEQGQEQERVKEGEIKKERLIGNEGGKQKEQETTAERIEFLIKVREWVRIQASNAKKTITSLYGIKHDQRQSKQIR